MNLTSDQIEQAINRVWEKRPNATRITMYAMVAMVADELDTDSCRNPSCEELIRTYIMQNLTVFKGRNGGIMRPSATLASNMVPAPVLPAINNHTCPSCGNTKVNKDERSCWKCGGNLH